MANKFTKSVLERQAKEMKRAPSGAANPEPLSEAELAPIPDMPSQPEIASIPAARPIPAPPEVPPETAVPFSPDSQPLAGDFIAETAPQPKRNRSSARPVPDLGDFIIRSEGRTAKNKTFYLDTAVIEGLKKAAAAQKVTESKLVNDILKRLLNV